MVCASAVQEQLKEFVTYLKSVLGLASVMGSFFPPLFVALGLGMIPPWPKRIEIIASGVCVFVLLSLFFGIRHKSKLSKRRWGSVLFVATFAALVLWIVSHSYLVVPLSDEYQTVRGFALRDDVSREIAKGLVENNPEKLLKAYGWNSAESIWTGVALARTLVCIMFILTFTAATGTLTAFALQDFK